MLHLYPVWAEDYTLNDLILRFGSCNKKQCFGVHLENDYSVEDTETFQVNLHPFPGSTRAITISLQTADITIQDDDCTSLFLNYCFFQCVCHKIIVLRICARYIHCFLLTAFEVGLEQSSYTVEEGDGLVEVCVAVTSLSSSCPVNYNFSVVMGVLPGNASKLMLLFADYRFKFYIIDSTLR